MPLYMDLHKGLKGLTLEEAEKAHLLDIAVQDQFGVKFHKFWVNEEQGTAFCLMEAPNKEACHACHLEAHGSTACELIEVHPSDVACFMGQGETTAVGAVVHPDGKMDSAVRTFLFTDIVGSTSMTEQFGDIIAMTILRKHNEIVRECLQKNNGREVKHTGDGIMAIFDSSSKAVRTGLEIQKAITEYRNSNPSTHLHLKIGINAGEPITEGDDFFGAAVQLTKRICDQAKAGEVLVSDVVKCLCMGRNFQFGDCGEHSLKGFSDPVKLYAATDYLLQKNAP
jgi:class 3 adenylate cyclase